MQAALGGTFESPAEEVPPAEASAEPEVSAEEDTDETAE
jgi:hypothetical protein